MRYCTQCGRIISDEETICSDCLMWANANQQPQIDTARSASLINTLSQRLNTNGIIWLVIGILQILGGIFINWFLLIVGVLNIISSINDMNYSKTIKENCTGIVKKFEPVAGPVITLIYNLVIGGVIGVVGSIYYFVAIRSFVMENKAFFTSLDMEYNKLSVREKLGL